MSTPTDLPCAQGGNGTGTGGQQFADSQQGTVLNDAGGSGEISWSDYVRVRAENGDGHLTLGEAKWQWQNGNGSAVTVDADKLDFSGLHAGDFPNGPGSARPYTLTKPQDFLVHGTVTTRLGSNSTISVLPDRYNFDIKPWGFGTFGRNVETLVGRYVVNGPGIPYDIRFRGTVPIAP